MKVQSGLFAFALVFGMASYGCSSGGDSSGSNSGGSSGGKSSSSSSSGGSGGSSSGGELCSEVEACGGDVVGTWDVKSQCMKFDGSAKIGYLGLTCTPNIATIKGSMSITGKLTLNGDGKFTDTTVTTGSEQWQLDKSCLTLSGTKVDCQSIGTTFVAALKGFGYESMVCKDASSGGGCVCDDKINTAVEKGRPGGMGILHNDAQTKGSYKLLEGNTIRLGDTLTYSYCVKGSEMTLSPIPVEDSGTPYKGTIVLTNSGGSGGSGGGGGNSSSAGGSSSSSSSSSSTSSGGGGGGSTGGATTTSSAKGGTGGTAGGAGGTAGKGGTTGGGGGTASTGGTATGGTSAVGGSTGGSVDPGKELPCDIYEAAKMPCASAYSMVRVLSKNYKGPLFQVRAGSSSNNSSMSGGTTKDIMAGADGFVDSKTVDDACGSGYCTVSVLYDQSGNETHLKRAPKGKTAGGDYAATDDYESAANKGKVKAGGHTVYPLYMNKREGMRSPGVGKGMPTGQDSQGTYMLADGTRKGSACCWDFGNATTKPETEWAFMDTISLGHTWWGNASDANWFGFAIDFEGGVWAGGSNRGDPGYGALDYKGPFNSKNPSMDSAKFALGMIGVSPSNYSIRVADLDKNSSLLEAYSGALPKQDVTFGHKGGVILGIGGDNSNNSLGTFYEGAMVKGIPSTEVEAAIMKNIKAVGYAKDE